MSHPASDPGKAKSQLEQTFGVLLIGTLLSSVCVPLVLAKVAATEKLPVGYTG
jgi:hypothetical protein